MCTALPMTLYYFPPSAPCRAVMLVARAAGVNLDLRIVDLMAGEHLSVDYIKINPQHSIPSFVEGDFILTESRAIMGYLVDRHADGDSLYPEEPMKRAKVNQRLYFDAVTLNQRTQDYMMPVIFRGMKPDEEQWKKVEEAFGFLDKFLEEQQWVTGDNITIADYAIVVTTSNAEAMGLEVEKFPNVARWYEEAKKEIDGYEELNQVGANQIRDMFNGKLNEISDS